VNLFSFWSISQFESEEDLPVFFVFVNSVAVLGFKSFGSEIGGGTFADSSVLVILRDLLTSLICFALKGSSGSSGASGFG
jgi:hypothetical protein